MELFLWKLKFYLKFYKSRKSIHGKSGLLSSVKIALKGFFSNKGHDSKLQTAFYNAYTSLIDTIISKRKRWISSNEERNLFNNWNKIYCHIRKEKLLKNVVEISPTDTRDLHKTNVINQITKNHKATRIIPIKL